MYLFVCFFVSLLLVVLFVFVFCMYSVCVCVYICMSVCVCVLKYSCLCSCLTLGTVQVVGSILGKYEQFGGGQEVLQVGRLWFSFSLMYSIGFVSAGEVMLSPEESCPVTSLVFVKQIGV